MKKKKVPKSLVRYRIVKSVAQLSSGLPPEYLQAIGEIAVNFALLELRLLWGISWFLREPDFKRILCVVGGEKFDILQNKLAKLVSTVVKNEHIKKEFDSIYTRLSEANSARNKYVHAIWSVKNRENMRFSPVLSDIETGIFKYKMHMGKDGSLSMHESADLTKLSTEATKIGILSNDLLFFLFEISGKGSKKRKRN